MRKIIIAVVVVLTQVVGCSRDFLDREMVGTSPLEIFDAVWLDLDEHYACFGTRGIDWDSVRSVYRPTVTAAMTEGQLWRVVTAMLGSLDDQHVSIQEIKDGYVTRSFVAGMDKVYSSVWFSKSHVYQYLETPDRLVHNDVVVSSVKGQDIGYLYLGSMLGYDLELVRSAMRRFMDKRALILDLRTNRGGYYEYVQELAGWLSHSNDVLWGIQVRSGNGRNDFGSLAWLQNDISKNPYQGKVVVLTNRATVSAGEWAVKSMGLSHNVTVIGDTTAGCLSALGMVRFLPNGWQYKYAIQKIVNADGSSYEGVGIPPDIYINNTRETYNRLVDSMMIKAIEYLSED